MARPRIHPAWRIKDVLRHVQTLPAEASAPLLHYARTSSDAWNLLTYVKGSFQRAGRTGRFARQHLGRLNALALVSLIETFERYLKEVAAACIDLVGAYVLDDRFDCFRLQGSALAAHFGTDTLGRALCESSTWLDTASINNRFKSLLADPFEEGKFVLFLNSKKDPAADRARYETLEVVWQLRHTVVHNVGVITQSDAVKFRLLVKEAVASPRLLVPTEDDIYNLKRFLDETVEVCNKKIGQRLAEVLTAIHGRDATLFRPQEAADRVTRIFGFILAVAGAAGVLSPP